MAAEFDLDKVYFLAPIESPIFSMGLSVAAKTIHRFSGYSQEVADFFMRLQKGRVCTQYEWNVCSKNNDKDMKHGCGDR